MAEIWQNRIVGQGSKPPEAFLANPDNWRTHPRHQKEALKALYREVGCVQNVIENITTGHLIDGHARIEIALEEGQPEVPYIQVELSPEEEAKMLATLDPVSGLAGTDQATLDRLLEDVHTNDEALLELLEALRGEEEEEKGQTDDDEVPEPPARAVTRPGDIWIMGQHRLICGDASDEDAIEALMEGKKADMVWTDPPYNVDYEGSDGKKIKNDKMADAAFRQFLVDTLRPARLHTKKGGAIYIAHADSEGLNFRAAAGEAGWSLRQCLIWVKNSFTIGRQDYQWQHEPVLYGWNPGASHKWYGAFDKGTVLDDAEGLRKLKKDELLAILEALIETSTVIREDKPKRNADHPTMKPVALIVRMIRNSSRQRDTVLDVFGGSGSTLIAAHKTGRQARLVELDPVYCDVIVRRYQEYTGREAHTPDGEYFNGLEPAEIDSIGG